MGGLNIDEKQNEGGKMEGKRMNGEGCVRYYKGRKCGEEGWAPEVEFSIIHLHRMATSGTLFVCTCK
jgi:hypothetical protein